MSEVKFTGYDSIFATRLRALMSENWTTQKDLAGVTGITRQAISQYMDGSIQPNIEKLYKICDYFKVSADFLLGVTELRSTDIDNKLINARLGLSDKAISILESNKNNTHIKPVEKIVPIVNFLIEQEPPADLTTKFKDRAHLQFSLEKKGASTEEIKNELIALDDRWFQKRDEWRANCVPVLNTIRKYFLTSSNEKFLYLTSESIKRNYEFETDILRTMSTDMEIDVEKVIDQTFLSEIEDSLKQLKLRYKKLIGDSTKED